MKFRNLKANMMLGAGDSGLGVQLRDYFQRLEPFMKLEMNL